MANDYAADRFDAAPNCLLRTMRCSVFSTWAQPQRGARAVGHIEGMIFSGIEFLPVEERRTGELVPLRVAVRRVFAVIYPHEPSTLDRLSALAQTIAMLVPIYTGSEGGRRMVLQSEVDEAFLREGGERLAFFDGRRPLTDLLISRSDVERAIDLLKQATNVPPSQPPARLPK